MSSFHFGTCLSTMLVLVSSATAGLQYTSGHADLGVAYEDGVWDLHFHAEGATVDGVFYADQEFEADEIKIMVTPLVTGSPPAAPFISDFWNIPESLGLTEGTPFYTLFQNLGDTASTNSPYLGIAGEEIDSSDFVGGVISIALTGFSGPGQFTLWQDGSGIKFNTLDGLGSDDVLSNFPTGAGAHAHFNYSFSAPGVYEVTLTASGVLAVGANVSSGSGTYTFVVVPEVSTFALSALGGLCMMFLVRNSIRRRLVRV